MEATRSGFIERSYHALFWPLLAAFLTFGVSFTIIGALLPAILKSFDWSYTAAGVVLASSPLGYTAASATAGLLIQRFGPKPVLTVGLLVLAASLFAFGALSSVPYNILMGLLIGVGQGEMEVVVNYSMVRMEREGQSHLMSFTHAAFSVGAIAGPTAAAVVLSRGLAWQTVYHLAAALTLAVALMAALLPFGRLPVASTEVRQEEKPRGLGRYPMLYLVIFLLFVYVGFESGISNWVSEYYVSTFSTPISASAFMVSLFWFGIFTGRLLLPLVYRGPRQAESLFALGALYTVSLFAALIMPGPISAAVFFYLTSLGCSAIYPLVMTLIGRYFERGQSVAVGLAASGGGAGSLVFPLAMSAVAESFGVHRGFYVYLAMGVVLTVLAYFVILEMRAKTAGGRWLSR